MQTITFGYKFVKAAHVARLKHPDIEYGEAELTLKIEDVERRKIRPIVREKDKDYS